ncbi:nucleoside triphosphate pyrophosphohydrolase [Spirochaeta isovalerica]|uniref:Tetrapyrrole methylase family protein/MazG family protein n=1 Tax=Spirochaeta isovalerica TaxID=150 RepID=A0A841R7S0_9SPIO|nr:nucleoside triphosphate pyrophosphohydrolase [Spirochaeta isovalerica]MBB6478788.1 tetrapyrrole methylase family protein/MazG family protein [Spirochaeta isovalerica]
MDKTKDAFEELYNVIIKLRGPDGCNWDKEQTPSSLRSDLIEETYECIEAIDDKDYKHTSEELGDLYLLVTMLAYMHEQEGLFTVRETLQGISEKLIRRHPHVFGESNAQTPDEIIKQWDEIKTEIEGRKPKDSVLDKISGGLPPLEKAFMIQKKAAKVGFDWQHINDIWSKVHEEIDEVQTAAQESIDELEKEIGDLLFAVVNIARGYKIDPAVALQRTNNKFTKRFHFIERMMKESGKELNSDNFELMDSLWEKAKTFEKEE